MAIVKWPGGMNDRNYFHGNDWHKTKMAAIARAEEMRQKKIKTLRKQIDRLTNLVFE